MLAVSNHLIFYVPWHSFQENLLHDVARHRGETDQSVVPCIFFFSFCKNGRYIFPFVIESGLSSRGGCKRAKVYRKTWYFLLCQLVQVEKPKNFILQTFSVSALSVMSVTSTSSCQCCHSKTKVNYGHCTAYFNLAKAGLIGRIILLLVPQDQLELMIVTQVTTGIKKRFGGACREETGVLKRFHFSVSFLSLEKKDP